VGQGLLVFEVSLSHSVTHTATGRTALGEWSGRYRVHYLTTHSTHKRGVGFDPTISVIEQPQTHVFDRAATGMNG
jgi:hypothetical protein